MVACGLFLHQPLRNRLRALSRRGSKPTIGRAGRTHVYRLPIDLRQQVLRFQLQIAELQRRSRLGGRKQMRRKEYSF
jgi:hypothetical protein